MLPIQEPFTPSILSLQNSNMVYVAKYTISCVYFSVNHFLLVSSLVVGMMYRSGYYGEVCWRVYWKCVFLDFKKDRDAQRWNSCFAPFLGMIMSSYCETARRDISRMQRLGESMMRLPKC